ncbi:Fanconi anemia group F protein [Synchiropus splendidus]|uniref:Fanconi anemia group F protein n=1 Tax=Synchiropus splendidus TaxID=270530 RepID=UPI00237DE886|nr:Fanconi anemia group F protein [Synchiropus splendidus]
MEAVLKNVANVVELLAVAAWSSEVELWDSLTLSRAFQWASYCEHIFSRFHTNQAIQKAIDLELRMTNSRLQSVFSDYTPVSFTDLSQSQHLLLTGLLKNPKISMSLMKTLFDDSHPVNKKNENGPEVTGMCSKIIQCKCACKILKPLTDTSGVGADAEVQGAMLMERLHTLLSKGSEACWIQHFLDSVLLGSKPEHFCQVIAAALLTVKSPDAQSDSVDFLLDWLRQKPTLLQHMCTVLPAPLLKDLTKEHLGFRHAHLAVLKKWTSDMEYDINAGEWVASSTDPTVTLKTLAGHFLALIDSCPSLAKTVSDELTALKVSDGDYNVKGLSVWGDLLSELQQSTSSTF